MLQYKKNSVDFLGTPGRLETESFFVNFSHQRVDNNPMTIVNPNLPANLFIHNSTSPVHTPEERQLDLRLEQVIRATVVEGGLDRALLEMNHQQFRAQTEHELQVGQQLTLQVLQTHPRMQFKVLNDPLNDRLSQLLPLLTRAYDWGHLVNQLRQTPSQNVLSQAAYQVLSQLQKMLDPTEGRSDMLKENISRIVAQLQQLSVPVEGVQERSGSQQQEAVHLPMQYSLPAPAAELSRTIMLLVKNLQEQLALLPKQAGQPLTKNWYQETRDLLAPLRQGHGLPQAPESQYQILLSVLSRIQQHPRVSPQLAQEVERILLQIQRQVSGDDPPQTKISVNSESANARAPQAFFNQVPGFPQATARSTETHSTKGADVLARISAEITQLLSLLPQGQVPKQGLSPELLGHFEGLLVRLQQLSQTAGAVPLLPAGFEVIVSQLHQLVSQQTGSPEGGQLGVLSQLFGFYLETELLRGKQKDALTSLKSSLLRMQKELGNEVEEPLRRIELFQLCKAKLAEDQIQFLPLPFNELEEGYLLAEKQHGEDDNERDGEPPMRLSLSLRLSALGNIRVDMFYEKRGLHLRLAGENQEKMHYLQNSVEELKKSIEAIRLHGISFSADAKLPARQLQERLMPDSFNMLDERI